MALFIAGESLKKWYVDHDNVISPRTVHMAKSIHNDRLYNIIFHLLLCISKNWCFSNSFNTSVISCIVLLSSLRVFSCSLWTSQLCKSSFSTIAE
jgi:hypothetical protein